MILFPNLKACSTSAVWPLGLLLLLVVLRSPGFPANDAPLPPPLLPLSDVRVANAWVFPLLTSRSFCALPSKTTDGSYFVPKATCSVVLQPSALRAHALSSPSDAVNEHGSVSIDSGESISASNPTEQKNLASTSLWFALWRNGDHILIDKLTSGDLQDTSDIADLKRAVKCKCPNILKDVDAGELTIYEPQAVDDKARANFTNGEYGRKFMRMGSPIPQGSSTSDIKPILVVAPSKANAELPPPHEVVKLEPFDKSKTPLLPLDKVPIRPIWGAEPAEFCVQQDNWLDNVVQQIRKYQADGEEAERISPMTFVRCSRGGKTRTLKEIQKELHSIGVPTIMVSFNDFSNVEDDRERQDPVGALCRRIAFAAMKNIPEDQRWVDEGYDRNARHLRVEPEMIASWLGPNQPCVLLIDELNVLLSSDSVHKEKSQELAGFLVKNFLKKSGRFFLFTSHISTKSERLSSFIQEASPRGVIMHRLPSIGSLPRAQKALRFHSLTATYALFYRGIPALIFEHRNGIPKRDKYVNILEEFTSDCNDETIRKMLSTYITGNFDDLAPVLFPLMDTVDTKVGEKVLWIFCHMVEILNEIISKRKGSDELRDNCIELRDLLLDFKTEKPKSGNAWESLFCATLLIRLISGQFNSDDSGGVNLLPLSSDFVNCRVSFDKFLEGGGIDYANVKNTNELIKQIKPPKKSLCPHVVVYKPKHSQFEMYDIVVVAYSSPRRKKIYGYQLKEGRASPEKTASDLHKSFFVCGDAVRKAKLNRKWIVVSDAGVSDFLGVSGLTVSPKEWDMQQVDSMEVEE